MRMNVRCCCQPMKILGTVDVPYPRARSVTFVQLDSFHPIGSNRRFGPVRTITLPIDNIVQLCDQKHLDRAVKAEGVDLEVLRKIPTFVEAT